MPFYNANTPAKTPLFVAPNFAVSCSLAAAADMTTTIGNPSSESPTMPGSNLLDPDRSKIWRSRGCFRIYSSTSKGYVFAPNTKIYINEGSGEKTVTLTEGTYTDPYDLAAEIARALNASADLALTYTVTYDDTRKSRTSATFKWTIAATGNFTIVVAGKNDDVMNSIGFHATTNYTGAATYTGGSAACHTEEYIIVKVPANLWGQFSEESGGGGMLNWIGLLDCNLRMGTQAAFPTGPKQAPKLYLYSTATPEFDDNPTGHSEGTDLFTFPLSTSYMDFPAYVGIDTGTYYGRMGYTSPYPATQRMILVDMAAWSGSYTLGASNLYLKFVVSDPAHPDGYAQLGTLVYGPGWYPANGYTFPIEWSKRDLSEVAYTSSGKRLVSTKRGFQRQVRVSFARSAVNDGAVANANTWTDAAIIEFWHRIYERGYSVYSGIYAISDPSTTSIGRGRVPILFIDRSWDPVVGNTTRSTSGSASVKKTIGHTPVSMYCCVEEDPSFERQFNNRWGLSLTLTEEI